jgi:cell division transport system permease protein
VTAVKYVSPEEARHQAIAKLEAESEISEEELAAMYEAPNKLPWTLNVKIVDLNDPSELEYFVYNDGSTKDLLDAKPPSFSSSHRETIDNIAVVMRGIEIGGLVAAAVFAVIAILVVFNTIRMAIFNRKEEIYMMKLIGARKGFVRGPFVVEAIIYGVVAGGIATGVTVGGVLLLDGKFGGALVPTVDFVRQWWWVVLAVLMGVGVLIGTVSAMLATKKYLKLK